MTTSPPEQLDEQITLLRELAADTKERYHDFLEKIRPFHMLPLHNIRVYPQEPSSLRLFWSPSQFCIMRHGELDSVKFDLLTMKDREIVLNMLPALLVLLEAAVKSTLEQVFADPQA